MKPGLIGSGPHIRHWRRSEFIFAVHPRTWTRRRGRESGLSEGNHDRPAVKFGPDDAFLTNLVKLLRVLPVFPMFGRGETKLQPVYVEDVAEAVTRLIANKGATRQPIYELSGPQISLMRNFCARPPGTSERVRSSCLCRLPSGTPWAGYPSMCPELL
jgi:hypothetical protein